MDETQQEILQKGYQALIDSLGIVDTIRFLQLLKPGQGDYSRDRHQWLDEMSLDEIFLAMRQAEASDTGQYDEIL